MLTKMDRLVIWRSGFGLGASLIAFGGLSSLTWKIGGLASCLLGSSLCLYLLATHFPAEYEGKKQSKRTEKHKNRTQEAERFANITMLHTVRPKPDTKTNDKKCNA